MIAAPAVDPSKVEPAIAGWIAERLVPKVLVASQTKVIEAIVDADGVMIPCTPVVTVEPNDSSDACINS